MTVPEAAVRLGMRRDAGYAAAARGDLPTIRIGRLLRVPIAGLQSKFGIEPPAPAENASHAPTLAKQLLDVLDMEKMDAAEVVAVWTLLKYLSREIAPALS